MNLQGHARVSALWLALLAGSAVIAPVASVSAAMAPRTSPAAPSDLTAVVGTDGRVNLHWTDNSTNETGFRIVREIRSGTNSWFASGGSSVSGNVTTYSESVAPATYRYKVRSYNARGNSSYTPAVTVTVSSAGSPPPPPP